MLLKLQRIMQEVNASGELLQAMSIVVQRVREVVSTEACSIYLYNEERSSYHLMAAEGFKSDCRRTVVLQQGQGLVGLIGKREEPLNLESAQEHPNYLYFPETGEEQFQAFLGAPIIHQRKVLGVLVVQQQQRRSFSEDEEAFLVTVSAQLASAIAHAEATGGFPSLDDEPSQITQQERVITGFAVSPGVCIGHVVVAYPQADLEAVLIKPCEDIAAELITMDEALLAVKQQLRQLTDSLAKTLPKEEVAIFEAHSQFLDEASLGGELRTVIQEGFSAQSALKKVINKYVLYFNQLEDDYLRERAIDISDIGQRLLKQLQESHNEPPVYPSDTILVGDEVTASLLTDVPSESLVGIVSVVGSKNSHVAILARALGIPVVMGAEGINLNNIDGQEAVIDGYHGKIYLSPGGNVRKEFLRLIAEDKAMYDGLAELADKPAQTPDGYHVPLFVNTGLLAEASASLERGAEGVGLYRTEIPFLVRDRFPTEKEQLKLYRQVLDHYYPRAVTMRTLDVGGDKVLPYFPIQEENPFLGWRGIRITLDHPELFLVQIRAMLRANVDRNNLNIMLPMISNLAEIYEAKNFIQQAYDELKEEGFDVNKPKVGVMIEIPAAAFQIEAIARQVDFVSVGTNDLTQYLLAVDRNNERVTSLYDSLHPAVLMALRRIAEGAHQGSIPVTVCGEMASDPAAVILLMAMGFDALSLNSASLLIVKWVIRTFSLEQAKSLLSTALTMETAQEIRHFMDQALDKAGLGGLIRAGK